MTSGEDHRGEPGRTGRRVARAGVALLALLLGLAGLEVAARTLVPDGYYVWPPGFERTFEPDPAFLPGIEGPSRFRINAWGIRGEPFDEGPAYRILALGGSTTICTYLDDAEAWPRLLQAYLEDALGPGTVWVGNVGRPGHALWQNRQQIEKLLPQYGNIDAVVLLAGVNDLLVDLSVRRTLVSPRREIDDGQRARSGAFSLTPIAESEGGRLARTGIGRLWRAATWRVDAWRTGGATFDRTGASVEARRELRRGAVGYEDDLPVDPKALVSYAKRVRAVVDAAHSQGARPLLMTQPMLWRDGLSDRERSLLWIGGVGPRWEEGQQRFFSPPALAGAMDRYNRALLDLCERRGVDCIDLAPRIPKDMRHFWDDAHFTEAGAELVARVVAEYLLATKPLSEMRRSGSAGGPHSLDR